MAAILSATNTIEGSLFMTFRSPETTGSRSQVLLRPGRSRRISIFIQYLIEFSDRYLGTMPPTTATPCTKRATTVLRCSLRPPTTVETVATSRRSTNIHSRTLNRALGITTRVITTTSSSITTFNSTLALSPPHLSSPIRPFSGCTRLSSSSCACATRPSTTIKSSASVSNTCTKRRARSRATWAQRRSTTFFKHWAGFNTTAARRCSRKKLTASMELLILWSRPRRLRINKNHSDN